MVESNIVDWSVIESLYINDNTTTHQQLADRFNKPLGTIKNRATKGKWLEKRNLKQANVIQKATEKATKSQIEIASKFNEDDIKLSQLLKSKVVGLLNSDNDLTPTELNACANTLATSQKIGRLALGLSTDNSMLSGDKNNPLSPPTFIINGVKPKNES